MNANVYLCEQNMSFWNSFRSNSGSVIDVHIISSRSLITLGSLKIFIPRVEEFNGSWFIQFVLFF